MDGLDALLPATVRQALGWGPPPGSTSAGEKRARGTPWWMLDQTCCLYRDKPCESSASNLRLSSEPSKAFPAPRADAFHGGSGEVSECREGGGGGGEPGEPRNTESPRRRGRSPDGRPTTGAATEHRGPLRCDRCDGLHVTESCPHFRKPREKHKDAWSNRGEARGQKNAGQTEKRVILKKGRVIPQPGDGSCLFHSLSHGLGHSLSAGVLRRQICSYIAENPDAQIADTSLREWVEYDSGSDDVKGYAEKMSSGSWGGGIEMAVLSMMKGVNVHVYERDSSGFVRISSFDAPRGSRAKCTINVLYKGRSHYDALDLA